MKAAIFFADTKVKEAFEILSASTRTEDRELVALLNRAFEAISANALFLFTSEIFEHEVILLVYHVASTGYYVGPG